MISETDTSEKKIKTTGIILFWIGIIVGIIAFSKFQEVYTNENEIGVGMISCFAWIISCVTAIVGALMFFTGKYQEKKQKKRLQETSPENRPNKPSRL